MDIILNLNGIEWRLDHTESYQTVKTAMNAKDTSIVRVLAGAASEATDLHIRHDSVVSWAVYSA